MKKPLLVCILVILASCSNSPKSNLFENNLNSLVHSQKGDGFFRGISPGDSIHDILDVENPKNLLHQDSILIKYRIMVSDSEYYDIDYVLDGPVVNFIKFDAVLPKVTDGDKFTDKLDQYFTKKCGNGYAEKGILTWSTIDSIHVELIDQSDEFGYGKILLYIYRGRSPVPSEDMFLDSNLFLPT